MYRFPKSHRLLKPEEFDRVFAGKRSRADRRLVVYVAPNECGHPRLGLVVSRKVGNSVVRGRWKRLLREAFRLAQHELPAADIVCLPRPQHTPTLEGLTESLAQLTRPKHRNPKHRRP